MNTNTAQPAMEVRWNDVKRIYVGPNSGCRCGCRGKYHEAGTRGYIMALNRASKLMMIEGVQPDDVDDSYANIPTGNGHAITLYLD